MGSIPQYEWLEKLLRIVLHPGTLWSVLFRRSQMNHITRRSALAAAATAGAAAFTQAADNKIAADEDRKRVIAASLTEAEADCWAATAEAAGKFFALPQLHVMDDHEVSHAIHVIQHKLLARPAYRKYLELAKAEDKKK
jgi:hypothetical protein